MKLNWMNLRTSVCPKCENELQSISDLDVKYWVCSCGFQINKLEAYDILCQIRDYEVPDYEDNLTELNNL